MNKKGFTLIELLAVIVILAIIALIATPIVLNIINDAKSESGLRSAGFYLDALELSIAQSVLKNQNVNDGSYNILENGNICLKYQANNTICEEELEVEVKGKTPKEGTITIRNGQIEDVLLTLNDKEIIKNSKGELVYIKTLEEVCELKEGTEKTVGSKYSCKVDPNKAPYTFYVLTNPTSSDEYINLIMDSNIRTGGEPVKEQNPTADQKGTVAWITRDDYLNAGGSPDDWDNVPKRNDKGPITAMNYLEEATKNWTNTNEITVNTFRDTSGVNSYSIAKTYKTYARMPYVDEVMSVPANVVWLIDYLHNTGSIEKNTVNQLMGYWALSIPSSPSTASFVFYMYSPRTEHNMPEDDGSYGVRPVISLKINK